MNQVRFKIAVVSGKGGVGKSTVSANLAAALAKSFRVGIIDFDFDGPSIPRLLGVKGRKMKVADHGFGIIPVESSSGVRVISTGFVIDDDEAIVWMGSIRERTMEQFLALIEYGPLDYLIMDLPPGTSSETFNLLRCLPDISGFLMVTIPSELSQEVSRRAIRLCQEAGAPILGLVENMSGIVCPACRGVISTGKTGGEKLAEVTGINFLGRVPLDPSVPRLSDAGMPFVEEMRESVVAKSFGEIVTKIHDLLNP
ncbi:MAG: P-loop NTPase [Syntrophales bacterium]|nr:P-loop NTPase [Syntrophales bacterium]